MNRITFVVGGARSGKTRYAEQLAKGVKRKTYIATALPFDEEMRERIRLHQDRRGEGWVTIETELDLAGALEQRRQCLRSHRLPDAVAQQSCSPSRQCELGGGSPVRLPRAPERPRRPRRQ